MEVYFKKAGKGIDQAGKGKLIGPAIKKRNTWILDRRQGTLSGKKEKKNVAAK